MLYKGGELVAGGTSGGGSTSGVSKIIAGDNITISPVEGTGGTASANPTRVKDGQSSNLTATASIGYSFSRWSDGNTQNPRTITVTDHTSLTASFSNTTMKVLITSKPELLTVLRSAE